MEQAPAIAYLRTDVSGAQQYQDECRMRRLSERLGYTLCETLVLCAATHSRIDRLLRLIAIERAEAVFVPHLDHLDGEHMRVALRADVIVDAHEVYARWPSITSSNGMTYRLSEECGDPLLPVRRSSSRDVRSPWGEPPRPPKDRSGRVPPHLRALPSPHSNPPQPGVGEIGDGFFGL